MHQIAHRIAEELKVRDQQTIAAIALLDEGATVPFISRYRKEQTGGLDDSQLRMLEDRLRYLRELENRRAVILKSIEEQGKLNDNLKAALQMADTKTTLEDLYLPYKPKRRTRAQMAREAGLEPLAHLLLDDPTREPEHEAGAFINEEHKINSTTEALEGARQILMEEFSEHAELIGQLREYLWSHAVLSAKVVAGKEQQGQKFSDYFDYHEPIKQVPSHRALALFRGRNEAVLSLKLDVPVAEDARHPCEMQIAQTYNVANQGRAGDAWLQTVVDWAWKVKIHLHLELDLMARLRSMAEEEAIRVFSTNLSALLLAAPAGANATLGLDPGLRTGVKLAVVDATGKVVDHGVIYPHAPKHKWNESIAQLVSLIKKHDVKLLSIGNGTGSRETDKLAGDLIRLHPEIKVQKVMVSEAGASIYSASELAAKEFPDLDVTIRGAVSIARRLQDPLAELVKIEPKAIGVGQYQHDVSQVQLERSLEAVIEDCVNAVGVDVNIASAALLSRVSGLNMTLAANMVDYRDTHGVFISRKQFLDIPRLGPKAFEQAAGFLRIRDGKNPLDASAVHPEAYPVVTRIAKKSKRPLDKLMGDSSFLKSLKPTDYSDEKFGLPTVIDIISELEKPGRDPRPKFITAAFADGVETLADLKPGMKLEGVVTNVTNFGAFVDIGVHQDGLVHISHLADRFVKDPAEVVKAGDVVKVRVMEVDAQRKRIALSMKSDAEPVTQKQETPGQARPPHEAKQRKHNKQQPTRDQHQNKNKTEPATAMALALKQALK